MFMRICRSVAIAILCGAPGAFAANISGIVFNDLLGNAVRDAGDPGLAGWTVNLSLGPTFLSFATTGAAGDYSFLGVTSGQTYTLTLVTPSGWLNTLPPSSNSLMVTPPAGAGVPSQDFGVFQTDSLSGNVYNDLNGNGNQNAGEPGLPGWTVFLPGTGLSALTDAGGNYTITGIGPGAYTLNEVVLPSWLQTQPVGPTFYSFTTTSGVNIAGGIFGNQLVTPEPGSAGMLLIGSGLLAAIRAAARYRR